MNIPETHCQSCAGLISMFNNDEAVCNECMQAIKECDEHDALLAFNAEANPEQKEYTELEKRKLRKVVMDTACKDIRAGYSFIRRMTQSLVNNEEYKKAVFLKELRLEIVGKAPE